MFNKNFLLLAFSFFGALASAAEMETPDATMKFISADGHPVSGVSLSAHVSYSTLSMEDCSGFICVPSLPRWVRKSLGGQILGDTDRHGELRVRPRTWEVKKISAKDLSVEFFTNGLISVYCGEKKSKETFVGYVEALPQFLNGKPTERNEDCTSMEFKDGDSKRIFFECQSPLSKDDLDRKVQQVKTEKCN
jgi:hypothetical protein